MCPSSIGPEITTTDPKPSGVPLRSLQVGLDGFPFRSHSDAKWSADLAKRAASKASTPPLQRARLPAPPPAPIHQLLVLGPHLLICLFHTVLPVNCQLYSTCFEEADDSTMSGLNKVMMTWSGNLSCHPKLTRSSRSDRELSEPVLIWGLAEASHERKKKQCFVGHG